MQLFQYPARLCMSVALIILLQTSCQQKEKATAYRHDSDGNGATRLVWAEHSRPLTGSVHITDTEIALSEQGKAQHAASAPALAAYFTQQLRFHLEQRQIALREQPAPDALILRPALQEIESRQETSDIQSYRLMGRISNQPDFDMMTGSVLPAFTRIAISTAVFDGSTKVADIYAEKQINRFYTAQDALDGILQLLDAAALDTAGLIIKNNRQIIEK